MKNKGLLYFLILVLIIIVVVMVAVMLKSKKEINSFEECGKAGYSIIETYPRQCQVPGGERFIEQVNP